MEGFLAVFTGFEGTLVELAEALKNGRLRPESVPLLALTRQVLERFASFRNELDIASEALPHLGAVIELKAKLLLPKQEENQDEYINEYWDEPFDEVIESVEALAKLDAVIEFLRKRRAERSKLLLANPAPLTIARKPPAKTDISALVEAAKRRVSEAGTVTLAFERLSLPQALEKLISLALSGRFYLEQAAEEWEERSVTFAALLEGIKSGELDAYQESIFEQISIEALEIKQIA